MTIIRNSSKSPEPTANKAYSHVGGCSGEIEKLLQANPNLWRGCELAGQGLHGRGTGFPQLDDILPGRGWPHSGLIEISSRCHIFNPGR